MGASVSAEVGLAIVLAAGLLIYAFVFFAARRLPPVSRALARLAPLLLVLLAFAFWVALDERAASLRDAVAPLLGPGSDAARRQAEAGRPREEVAAPRSLAMPGRQNEAAPATPTTRSEANPPERAAQEPGAPRVALEPEEKGAGADKTSAASRAETPAASEARKAVEPGSSPSQQASADFDVVAVFYGTDRERKIVGDRTAYGSLRARRLELGRAQVTIPKSHQVPVIERPYAIRIPILNWTVYEQAEDPKQHFTLQQVSWLTPSEFLAAVRQHLAASRVFKSQAFIFVHGYNTAFDFALFRTAQMAYDLQFDGAAFLYSWPSGEGVMSYGYDRESSLQAEPYLREFIELVIKDTGAQSVSLIAHSMGNLPLLEVLRDLGPTLPQGVQLNQIVLAAPDVDRDVFAFLAANIKRYGRGVTLYASANDRAMAVARRVAGGVPRAGDVPADGPIVVEGIDTIDVSQTSTDYLALNHSAYAEKSALLSDIAMLLQTGERPPDRRIPILLRIPTAHGDFWRYPPSGG
jgi:esterase/lipase superfamily enzyme